MKTKIVCVVSIVLVLGLPVHAQQLEEERAYVLKLPVLLERDKDYDAEAIWPYDVKVSYLDEHTFLVRPVYEIYGWMKSFQEPNVQGWIGTTNPEGVIAISGVEPVRKGIYAFVELTGEFVTEDTIKGQAVLRIGGEPSDVPYIYRCEWGITPLEREDSLNISLRVTYEGPRIDRRLKAPSREEMAQWPVNPDFGIKDFAAEEPQARERFYQGIPPGRRRYYEKLLAELIWEEIPYMPGILLLIDHLVTVDEQYKQKIAEGAVTDGSLHLFDPIPYEDLQQVPPLFLILYVFEKMPESDIAGLQEVSSRFVTMLEAYKMIPPEELTDLPLLEFLIKLSEQLPEEFRQTYFSQSPKLRDYVGASEDERLKELYPF